MNFTTIKEFLVASVGFGVFILAVWAVGFALYIGMVAEPDCQRKGFASADSNGCWIIKNGERIYENN